MAHPQAVSLQGSAPYFGCYSLSLHCTRGLQQPLPLITSTSGLLFDPHFKPNNLYLETGRDSYTSCLNNFHHLYSLPALCASTSLVVIRVSEQFIHRC